VLLVAFEPVPLCGGARCRFGTLGHHAEPAAAEDAFYRLETVLLPKDAVLEVGGVCLMLSVPARFSVRVGSRLAVSQRATPGMQRLAWTGAPLRPMGVRRIPCRRHLLDTACENSRLRAVSSKGRGGEGFRVSIEAL
jgi:hypothetical protein